MNKAEILNYLKSKIPDYSFEKTANTHLLQFMLYVYPFIYKGKTQWFVEHLVTTLEEIERYVPGYAKRTIDKLSKIGRSQPQQIFQDLGEVLVLFNLISMAATDKSSVELEPRSRKGGKNPEYRLKINDVWFAVEVKTPDLTGFTNIRQNGLQVTSRISEKEKGNISSQRQLIFSKDLKIQEYLRNAEDKFSDYRLSDFYKNDKTILVIIWDDFVNEAISTLKNPNSGLLTKNSFYKESSFPNVDAVIVLRHLHHLKHLFYFGELLVYKPEAKPSENVFNLLSDYDVTKGIYIKNPSGSHDIQFFFEEFVDYYDIDNNHLDFVAEYHATDFVDWSISTGVSGLNYCSQELREKIIPLFLKDRAISRSHSKITCDFTTINLKGILESHKFNEVEAFDVVEKIVNLSETSLNLDKLPKLELAWQEVQILNRNIKKMYNKLKSTKLIDSCPCRSNKKYLQCCYNKLRYFTFSNYYTP